MEKQIGDLTVITRYQNRQVILNYYDEDMLIQRDGFHFESIQLIESYLSFSKKDGSKFTIELTEYPSRYVNNDFQNYYILRSNSNRLEIYFP